MIDVNRLVGGLNTDVNPQTQPEHTLRNCINFVPLSTEGNIFSLTNENGTKLMENVSFPTGMRVIGYTVLNKDIIVILVDENGYSQIGCISEDSTPDTTYGYYHPIAPVNINNTVPTNNTEFGFSVDHPVDCTARTLINGHRILYYTDNYTPFGVVDLDSPPIVGSVASTVRLTFTQTVPEVTVTSITEGVTSTIVPGIYQFVTRYVTATGDTTTYGIPSQPLPMTPENRAVGVNSYHGEYASYGTISKNVNLQLSNLDTRYSELELIVIYYESSASILKATVCGRIPITDTTINYVFTGPITENILQLTKEELRQVPVSYTKAKCIEQKDNRLFLSNLTSNKQNFDDTLQQIANAVEVSYKIDEKPFSRQTGNFDDYIDEIECQEKTYRRGEVYSLGFCLLYADGTRSANYHIPGAVTTNTIPSNRKVPNASWPSFAATNNSTARLGTFVSTETYPVDQMYPGDLTGDDVTTQGPSSYRRNIRHHYMPELQNEPHFRTDSRGNILVRILELEFEFTIPIPDEILQDTVEIIFTREQRNTSQNRSVLSQGVINHEAIIGTDYNDDGAVEGTLIGSYKDGYQFAEVPFFNNLDSAEYIGPVGGGFTSGAPGLGFAFPNYTCPNSLGGTYADGKKLSTDVFTERCVFHSPETELKTNTKKLDINEIDNAYLKPVLTLSGVYSNPILQRERWTIDNDFCNLANYLYADVFGNYNSYTTETDSEVQITEARFTDKNLGGQTPLVSGGVVKTYTRFNGGGLELRAGANIPERYSSKYQLKLDYLTSSTASEYYLSSIWDVDEGIAIDNATTTNLKRNLFNIVKNNTSQYGGIGTNEYILIARRIAKTGTTFISTYTGIKGGDTFITKFAYNDGVLLPYYPFNVCFLGLGGPTSANDYYREVNGNSRLSQTYGSRAYFNVDDLAPNRYGDARPANVACGFDLRWTTYFFVESDINTYYRHIPEGSLYDKYYPLETDTQALLQGFYPYNGNSSQLYNDTYSFENAALTFYTRDSISNNISKFETRTIYSEVAANDDVRDAFRSFLTNSYYDLPAHTGPIWDSFVEYNTLFLHTPKALWRTFAEPAATIQGGNISDIVLGTGNLFSRPSTQIFTTTGGYGGTLSQFGGVHTRIGYVFPDILQGKIFGLVVGDDGPYLKDLSEEGVSTYCSDTMKQDIIYDSVTGVYDYTNISTDGAYLIDNPFNGVGFLGGFDYKLKRFWIVKQGVYGFTISYSTVLNKWSSFHTYQPDVIIPYNDRVFFLKMTSGVEYLYEMNKGLKGEVFTINNNTPIIHDSNIVIVSAVDTNIAKTYQNIKILSKSFDRNNNHKVRDDNFDTLQVYNDRQNTSVYNLIHGNVFGVIPNTNECLIKFRNDEYNIAIPRDAVIDNSLDITNPANLDNYQRFKERIKGNYAIFVFNYNNNLNYEFYLKQIDILYNKNIR